MVWGMHDVQHWTGYFTAKSINRFNQDIPLKVKTSMLAYGHQNRSRRSSRSIQRTFPQQAPPTETTFWGFSLKILSSSKSFLTLSAISSSVRTFHPTIAMAFAVTIVIS